MVGSFIIPWRVSEKDKFADENENLSACGQTEVMCAPASLSDHQHCWIGQWWALHGSLGCLKGALVGFAAVQSLPT